MATRRPMASSPRLPASESVADGSAMSPTVPPVSSRRSDPRVARRRRAPRGRLRPVRARTRPRIPTLDDRLSAASPPQEAGHPPGFRTRLRPRRSATARSRSRLVAKNRPRKPRTKPECARKAWERRKRKRKPFDGTQRVTNPARQSWPAAGSESCVVTGRPPLRSVDSE
jgi:hypothetical protein